MKPFPFEELRSEVRLDAKAKFTNLNDGPEPNLRDPKIAKACFEAVIRTFPSYEEFEKNS